MLKINRSNSFGCLPVRQTGQIPGTDILEAQNILQIQPPIRRCVSDPQLNYHSNNFSPFQGASLLTQTEELHSRETDLSPATVLLQRATGSADSPILFSASAAITTVSQLPPQPPATTESWDAYPGFEARWVDDLTFPEYVEIYRIGNKTSLDQIWLALEDLAQTEPRYFATYTANILYIIRNSERIQFSHTPERINKLVERINFVGTEMFRNREHYDSVTYRLELKPFDRLDEELPPQIKAQIKNLDFLPEIDQGLICDLVLDLNQLVKEEKRCDLVKMKIQEILNKIPLYHNKESFISRLIDKYETHPLYGELKTWLLGKVADKQQAEIAQLNEELDKLILTGQASRLIKDRIRQISDKIASSEEKADFISGLINEHFNVLDRNYPEVIAFAISLLEDSKNA